MRRQEINAYLQLQSQIIAKKNEVEGLRVTVKVAEEELKKLEAVISRTEIDVNLDGYNERISLLNQEVVSVDETIAKLGEKKASLEAQITDLQTTAGQLSEAISSKNNEINQKKQQITDLKAQEPTPEIEQQIKTLEEEIVLISRDLEKFSAELRKNQSTQKVLLQEIAVIDKEVIAQTEKKTKLQNEITKVQGEFADSQSILDGFNTEKENKEDEITSIKDGLGTAIQELEAELELYKPISDPRTLVEAVDDDTPFLLLPIRLETRFMTIKHVRRVDELTEIPLEPVEEEIALSEDPDVNVKFDFGEADFVKKDQVDEFNAIPRILEEDERVIPDKHELWVRIFPDDIAIHTHEERLTADEYAAGQNYWNEVWTLGAVGPDPESERLGPWRALVASYGPERSAWIVSQTEPTNITDDPGTLPTDPIYPTLVLKPAAWNDQAKSKVMPDRFVARVYTQSGGQKEILGNLIPDPLPIGINPSSATLDDDFDQEDTQVAFPTDIKWLTDFNEAEEVGMGIRIPLEGNESEVGFSKLLVLGLKLAADKDESKDLLEELIDNHHYTKGGFSLLEQGTPTNNTEDAVSGYESHEIGDEESFAIEMQEPLFQSEAEKIDKSDGQWFAEMLGISEEKMHHIRNANKYDQQEGMAMNRALWPATMGYYIKQMLTPLVFAEAHNDIRTFVCDYMIARGRIPSFRVGNQPYGVLLASSFSRWQFPTRRFGQIPLAVRGMFENILQPINANYADNISNITHAGSGGDPQANFLDMIGLHASSVEFHQRFGSGQYFSWNLLQYFENAPNNPVPPTAFPLMDNTIPDNLRNLYMSSSGFNISINPRILQMLFVKDQRLLNGPVIDLEVLPFSEKRGIQDFPDTDTNYIEWMLNSDFNTIRNEDFSAIPDVDSEQKPPQALLYLLLRHGCLLEYVNTALQILIDNNEVNEEAEVEFELQKEIDDTGISVEEEKVIEDLVTAEVMLDFEVQLARLIELRERRGRSRRSLRESVKERIRRRLERVVGRVIAREIEERKANYAVEQDKWSYLEQQYPNITGEQTMLEHILSQLEVGDESTEYLAKIKESLEVLKDMPTARLERCLAESLDICNYRLDAWLLALVNQRVENQLQRNRDRDEVGTNLGAFGMLEGLTPNSSFPGITVSEVEGIGTDPSSPLFVYMGEDPLTVLEYNNERDIVEAPPRVNGENLGYIHGPSMNHAVAAAILRAGYGAHEGTDSPDDAMAINLRSDRVRKALFYMEGIKNGQDLAALLGYQFERGLHDLDLQLDQFILDIRRQFSLVANGVVNDGLTPSDPNYEPSVEAFEARNVVDGLQLIEAYREDPIGWQIDTGITDATAIGHINDQIIEITNHMDAISDLMMAESMYQVATGNHERAGAVIKAMGEGNVIPDPQIIKTPRLDKVFMQRKAIMFDTSLSAPSSWPGNESPRSYSEPALNCWIKCALPNPSDVIINYTYTTYDMGGNEILTDDQMMLSELGLQPIDFVYMLTDQGGTEDGTMLSALVNYIAINTISNTEVPVTIKYMNRTGLTSDQITIFEILPLVRTLKDMMTQGRAARAEDFVLENEVYDVQQAAAPTEGTDLTNVEARLIEALGPATTPGRKGLKDVRDGLDLAKVDIDSIVTFSGATEEGYMIALRASLMEATCFNIQGAIPESASDYTIEARDVLSAQAARVLSTMNTMIATLTQMVDTELPAIVEVEDRLEKLQDIAHVLFGRDFKVFPEFNFFNQADIDLSRANANLLDEAGDFGLEEWLHGISKVRPRMGNYHLSSMVRESLLDEAPNREVIQLPIESNTDDRWLGATLPAGYEIPDQAISVVMDLPNNYMTGNLQSGIILDEWNENIPDSEAITGLSFNYDQPNSEAPNTLLMAVTPEETGNWDWNDLMDILSETLELAKKRAIDPDLLNVHSPLGHALPALMASVEEGDTAPGLDFSRNIIEAESGQVGPIDLQQYINLATE